MNHRQSCNHVRNSFAMRYEIDGSRFTTLEEFFDEVSRAMIPRHQWGHNLDAFNDVLRGGFGTPPGGFTIVWKNHALSKERLAWEETVRQLELRLNACHPQNRDRVSADLQNARAHLGSTVFQWLINIIAIHGPGGREAQDGVKLVLD